MPRPNPPPTPGSSSDIRGKEGAHTTGLGTFNLPPTAYHEERDRASSTPSNNGSDSSYRPISPALPGRRPAGAVIGKEDFELPPPPTRSRKIIQMKPQGDGSVEGEDTRPASQHSNKGQSGGKRKANAGTTAAGRKIARKTAHSLIERRRRSKMNEEFGVLKDMIPACKGQEMHKLAILQASIDYLRYLEKCVSDLQQNKRSPSSQRPPAQEAARQPQQSTMDDEDEEEEEDEEDEEMEDEPPTQPQSAVSTPAFAPQDKRDSQISLPSLSTITTTSPSIFSHTAGRHYSISSASQASYSPYFHSAHTSPAFGPQLSHHASHSSNGQNGGHLFGGIGSPALKPQDQTSLRQIAEGASAELSLARPATNGGIDRSRRSEHELDQEAAGGLLMLNNDRRSWQQKEREKAAGGGQSGKVGSATGMSVKDLLTG